MLSASVMFYSAADSISSFRLFNSWALLVLISAPLMSCRPLLFIVGHSLFKRGFCTLLQVFFVGLQWKRQTCRWWEADGVMIIGDEVTKPYSNWCTCGAFQSLKALANGSLMLRVIYGYGGAFCPYLTKDNFDHSLWIRTSGLVSLVVMGSNVAHSSSETQPQDKRKNLTRLCNFSVTWLFLISLHYERSGCKTTSKSARR